MSEEVPEVPIDWQWFETPIDFQVAQAAEMARMYNRKLLERPGDPELVILRGHWETRYMELRQLQKQRESYGHSPA